MSASRELKQALTRHLRVQPTDAQVAYEALRESGSYVELQENPDILAEDPVDILFNTIDLQPQSHTVQLLSGFRGTGKTTALLRLRERLESAGYAALRIDVRDYLSTESPLKPEEFLLFIAAAAATEAQARGLTDCPEATEPLGRVRRWLSRITVGGASLQIGGAHANVALTLGLADPDRLAELRKTIGGQTREFARDVAEDLRDLRESIARCGGGELVVIVDSVERYRGTYGDTGTAMAVQAAMEALFSVNADLLDPGVAGLHLIYTVPPYLKWLVPGLGNRFEPGGLSLIPAVKVTSKDGNPFEEGVDALVDLVQRRLSAALFEVEEGSRDPDSVIGRDELRAIVMRTGGVPRELIRAVQGVVTRLDELPVPPDVAERALQRIESEYEFVDEDVPLLAAVHPDTPPPIADAGAGLALWARQLDSGNVLCYENGTEWYAVNPLIAKRVTRRWSELGGGPAPATTHEPSEGED